MHSFTITRIDIFKFSLPLIRPLRIAIGEFTHSDGILIRIWAGDQLYGLGEASPAPFITGETQATCFEAGRQLAPLLLGKDALDIESRMRELNAALVHHSSVKCAFDMALYDLAAKGLGLPLYAFLGGGRRDFYTDFTIGIDTPEAMAEAAAQLKASGAYAIKAKLGTTLAADVARIRAIRAAIGDEMPLRIDANQGWDEATAIATLQALEPFQIQYCEQPVVHWNLTALKRVRSLSPIPIMADESLFDHHDAFRLASMGACDYFNIKLGKAGGIHTARKIVAIAEAAGIPCMVGCFTETLLGISAGVHFVSAYPHIIFADLDSLYFYADAPITGGALYDGAHAMPSDAPGHGADVKPEALEQMEGVTIAGQG
jgi:L-alanine-DL-glutamate epimerase-like enolase superfamily enzyme